MKHRYLIIIILTVLLAGCSDYLDEKSITDLTSDLVYNDPEGLKFAIIGLYHQERLFYTFHNEGRHAFSLMCGTDISVYRTSGDAGAARYDASLSPTNLTVEFFWSHFYEIVERANSIIYYANKLDMPEAERRQILGEAKCARAHAYFHLLRMFDNIYLTEEPTTGMKKDFAPASMADVYALITRDLDDAIEYLDYLTPQPGRYTKGVARHLRAQVAMWQNDWDEAANQATTLISDGPYSLLSDVNDIFMPDQLNHAEAIYVYHFSIAEPEVDRLFHRMPILLMPRYGELEGLMYSAEYAGYAWGRLYPNDYFFTLFEPDDKRLTAYFQTYFLYNNPDAKLPPGAELGDTATTTSLETYFQKLHPGCKKYWDFTKDVMSRNSYKDVICYRLAETYLIAAEALWRDGRMLEGILYINAIRERALGTAGIVDYIDEDLILDEHARELAFENLRWYTLKRMGKLVERVRLYGGDEYHLEPRINIQDHHVRKPIPQKELDLMSGYPQNPGYEALGK